MRIQSFSVVVGLSFFLVAQAALSYTRTINGRIYFEDERIHTNTAYGSKLTAPASQRQLRYVRYYVVAYCTGYMAYMGLSKYTSAYGLYSETFTTACSNPGFKIYITLESKLDGEVFHRVVDTDGTDPDDLYAFTIHDAGGDEWFRPGFGTGSSETKWQSVNISCPEDYHYYCSVPTDSHYDQTSHQAANVYATGVDVALLAGMYDGPTDNDASGPFYVFWPCTTCDSNEASGYSLVRVRDDLWDSNHRGAHEFGHLYMKRALGTSAVCSSGTLAYDINGDGHEWDYGETPPTSREESLASSEGWANFFAVATYFDDDATEPFYRWCKGLSGCLEADNFHGDHSLARAEGNTWAHYRDSSHGTSEPCADHENANDHQNEGNVTRFFWDLYDSTNESSGPDSGYDNQNMDIDEMLEIWECFRGHNGGEDRFGNRGYLEYRSSCSVFDDEHGRNALDYRWVSYNSYASPYFLPQHNLAPIYRLNCLEGSE